MNVVNCPTIQASFLHLADPSKLHVLGQVHIVFLRERKVWRVFTILSSFYVAHISTNMANLKPSMKSCLDEPCAFRALGMQVHSWCQEPSETAVPVGQIPTRCLVCKHDDACAVIQAGNLADVRSPHMECANCSGKKAHPRPPARRLAKMASKTQESSTFFGLLPKYISEAERPPGQSAPFWLQNPMFSRTDHHPQTTDPLRLINIKPTYRFAVFAVCVFGTLVACFEECFVGCPKVRPMLRQTMSEGGLCT